MTTKKQRREKVAAKRKAFNESMKRLGLKAQQEGKNKREAYLSHAIDIRDARLNPEGQ